MSEFGDCVFRTHFDDKGSITGVEALRADPRILVSDEFLRSLRDEPGRFSEVVMSDCADSFAGAAVHLKCTNASLEYRIVKRLGEHTWEAAMIQREPAMEVAETV